MRAGVDDELLIRIGVRADADAIAAVHVASRRDAYRGLLPEAAIANDTEKRRASWDRVLVERARCVFVAETPGAIDGFVCGGSMPASIHGREPLVGYDAYLDALYVRTARHGRGIGRALVAALVHVLLRNGARSLALHVVAGNPAASFYEHLGAHFIRTEPPAEEGGVPLAYGWRDLRAGFR